MKIIWPIFLKIGNRALLLAKTIKLNVNLIKSISLESTTGRPRVQFSFQV